MPRGVKKEDGKKIKVRVNSSFGGHRVNDEGHVIGYYTHVNGDEVMLDEEEAKRYELKGIVTLLED